MVAILSIDIELKSIWLIAFTIENFFWLFLKLRYLVESEGPVGLNGDFEKPLFLAGYETVPGEGLCPLLCGGSAL